MHVSQKIVIIFILKSEKVVHLPFNFHLPFFSLHFQCIELHARASVVRALVPDFPCASFSRFGGVAMSTTAK